MDELKMTKQTMDMYLYELGKALKKQKSHAEIIIVGGAAIMLGYGFRDTTTDIDAIYSNDRVIKDVISIVSDKLSLPPGWINTDFIKTKSYSQKLVEHSRLYKNFCHALDVRIIYGEYLFAMKLASCRQYKRDISDLVGLANELAERGEPLTQEKIDYAVQELYEGWDKLPNIAKDLTALILSHDNLEELYYETLQEEDLAKAALVRATEKYAESINEHNIDSFINFFKEEH